MHHTGPPLSLLSLITSNDLLVVGSLLLKFVPRLKVHGVSSVLVRTTVTAPHCLPARQYVRVSSYYQNVFLPLRYKTSVPLWRIRWEVEVVVERERLTVFCSEIVFPNVRSQFPSSSFLTIPMVLQTFPDCSRRSCTDLRSQTRSYGNSRNLVVVSEVNLLRTEWRKLSWRFRAQFQGRLWRLSSFPAESHKRTPCPRPPF